MASWFSNHCLETDKTFETRKEQIWGKLEKGKAKTDFKLEQGKAETEWGKQSQEERLVIGTTSIAEVSAAPGGVHHVQIMTLVA